jgi:hypothetical protein
MSLILAGVVILTLCALLAKLRPREPALGWMSDRWLAEHRAAKHS